MKIAVIGTGYVGLVSTACFADLGHEVWGMDIDEKKIDMIKSGKSPIFEPGLEEVLQRGLENGRLHFTTDLAEALKEVEVVFSAVATPPNEDFSADLRNIFIVCENIAKEIDHDIVRRRLQRSLLNVALITRCLLSLIQNFYVKVRQ
jgi:UDPglucose 6-dehydrogenase